MITITEYIQQKQISKSDKDLLFVLDQFINDELLGLDYTVNTGKNEGNKNEWISTPNHIGIAKYFRNIDGWPDHYDKWIDCFKKIAKDFSLDISIGPSTVLDNVIIISLTKNLRRVCTFSIHPNHIAIIYYEDNN